MGYRSDVIVIIHRDIIPQWLQMLCQNKEARELVFSYRDDSNKNFADEGHLFYRWNSVKWYDSYECVGAINKFLGDIEDGEHYRYVRAGEEGDDVEADGFLHSESVFPVVENYIEIDMMV